MRSSYFGFELVVRRAVGKKTEETVRQSFPTFSDSVPALRAYLRPEWDQVGGNC